MKSNGLCQVKGCGDSPTHYPVLLLVAEDGSSLPAIIGLKICRKHKRATRDIPRSWTTELVEALTRAGVRIVRRHLVWTPIDGPEGRAFARMQRESTEARPS
jgi:hypothetical protein